MPPASAHAAYVFDAYGTLFDVHAAVRRHAADVGPDGPLLSDIWRAKQLEYSWVRSLMGAHADFWQLTEQGPRPRAGPGAERRRVAPRIAAGSLLEARLLR